MNPRNPTHRLFAGHGLRVTRQRAALYETLCATDRHPTDELFASVQVSRATVYNNIDVLADAGLIQVLPPQGHNGPARYDATTDPHLHLRDRATGQVVDAPGALSKAFVDALPAEVLGRIEREAGFKIDRVRVELVGRFG